MTEKAPVFKQIVKDYLLQVSLLGTKEEIVGSLGIIAIPDGYRIQFFRETYIITSNRIVDANEKPASHIVSVILCKYLLLSPKHPSDDISLVTYKDFRDAAPYVGGFRNTAEQPIAKSFENAFPELKKKCQDLGGLPFNTEVSCQLAIKFQALPTVPIFLLFNDADEDFPAQATLLFQKNAAFYLDMECLAMIGSSLAYQLRMTN